MARSSSSSKAAGVKRLFDEAVAHHQAGRLEQAEAGYQKILTAHPSHADTLHLLGLIAYRRAHYARALELITQAIQRHATQPLFFYNQGLVYQALRQWGEAERAYRHALSLKPDYIDALGNLGHVLREQGALEAACAVYEQVVTLKPDHADGFNNVGVVLKEQGKAEEARDAWQQALALNPDHAEAHCNLGLLLFEGEYIDEALERLQAAVSVKPHYAKAWHGLGLARLWNTDLDGALLAFRTSANLTHNHGRVVRVEALYASRIQHDAEQLRYLAERALFQQADSRYEATLRALQRKVAQSVKGNPRIPISREEADALAPSLSHILYYAETPALPQGALNPALDREECERRYQASRPEMIVIDAFLRSEAVVALRQFCRESTIWKKDYDDGYIGAFLGEGFSSPLLLQVAEELRTTFPGIFHGHRLLQAWAFKQDNTRRPLKIHADAAAVNVNFWITADSANLDPTCGGLIVWDKEAPRDWDFAAYNSTALQPGIADFLKRSGAEAKKVPYRENRAVIFNSDLFHESDTCVFRDDYESRRLNITFLYGRRRGGGLPLIKGNKPVAAGDDLGEDD